MGRNNSLFLLQFFFQGVNVEISLADEWERVRQFLNALGAYQPHQRELILRAAWWLRQSQHSFLSGISSPSSFAIYSAYWNAFECLIEVLCDLAPPPSSSPTQKAKDVAEFFQNLSTTPTSADVETCYRLYVNPGLPKRARHALALAFGPVGEQYITYVLTKDPNKTNSTKSETTLITPTLWNLISMIAFTLRMVYIA